MTDSKPKDGRKPVPVDGPQSPAPKDYLPGGHIYRDALNNMRRHGNPRQGAPVPQWICEWEEKWQRITSEGKNNGKPKL
ncbi:hypothetical protein ABVK25_007065 [Lepraria finkii]|uniref:Ribosome modulation factor n=1 Tax=Lepraria finkii TaxID=1340010 RepID=A0ABR4B3P5_9LECA